MYQQRTAPIKTYDVHPISIKLIKQGNPWVTKDKFSEKFHPKERFIVAANRKRPFALLLHDPTHKQVRARVWATNGNFQKLIKSFKNDLSTRIKNAVKKRCDKKYIESRNHFYLIFGEADQIPGIFVHFLNGEILVQIYMEFWNHYQDFFIQTLIKEVNASFDLDITPANIWMQTRSQQKVKASCSDPNTSFRNVELTEFGVKYKATLGKYYDHGIYTDMAAIRGKLKEPLSKAKSVLNLYSYTGAFSLFAMSLNADDVVSVDLSKKYLDWLEENIKLNDDFKDKKHESMAVSTKSALDKFNKENRKFDFIISDPPSSSSDGKKRGNALNDYSENLPIMEKITEANGQILVFLNTHRCSSKKFEERIKKIIQDKNLKLKIQKRFFLSDDCPGNKNFPEGNYLKGLLLSKHD